jgi:xanthine dehydrogenase YagS FAD-binding subunit
MKDFNYIRAGTVEEAVSFLSEGGVEVIAGGTDLLGRLKAMISPKAPDVLVSIKTIPELYRLKEENSILAIGALVKLADIAKSAIIRDSYTALAEAAGKVGTPELRNMATIGGNICQFVRCWYYRAEHNAFNCLRKNPAGICHALSGDNRYHSILGAVNGCIAVNPGDLAPVLMALNASIFTSQRTIAADKFFAMNGEKTTIINYDEIITEVRIQKPAPGTKSAFIKFAQRKAFDFPVVNCAAVIGDSSARICLNAIHNMPYRATSAENTIIGRNIDDINAEEAGNVAIPEASELTMNKYKVHLARIMVKKAILACKK